MQKHQVCCFVVKDVNGVKLGILVSKLDEFLRYDEQPRTPKMENGSERTKMLRFLDNFQTQHQQLEGRVVLHFVLDQAQLTWSETRTQIECFLWHLQPKCIYEP